MKKLLLLWIMMVLGVGFCAAQEITWTEIINPSLPEGVTLFSGTRDQPILKAYYLNVDLNNPDLGIRPYIFSSPEIVPDLVVSSGAYAAVNGGFFGGSTSYSSVVYPGEMKAVNVQAVTRTVNQSTKSYPVIRSMFSLDTNRTPAVNWIYHFNSTLNGLYTFSLPLPYIYNDPTPLPAPLQQNGQLFSDILVGIGGAPTLVKDSVITITYDEEIMWGSGVGLENCDPRTAVGYTSDNHIVLLVADGRQSESDGLSLPELAQVFLSLGCVEAMNLDGGGSTQMAVGNSYINSPSESRAIPTILAVVHADSMLIPPPSEIEKIIDTGDSARCQINGSGWFPTANPGYWGSTPSLLHSKGDGSNYVLFKPDIDVHTVYEVYAWWVASSNRCTDTPIIIKHQLGIDTVRVNQTGNGSSWVPVGAFEFGEDTSQAIIVSDAAKNGTYVVADAVRLVARPLGITQQEVSHVLQPVLKQNFPNPFNPETMIEFYLPRSGFVSLQVYDITGKIISTVWQGQSEKGVHRHTFSSDEISSGIYFYQLKFGRSQSITRKMVFFK